MGPRHRTKGRSAGGYQLQNHPYYKRGRRGAQEIHRGTIGERVHSEVQIPLRISLLFHQKEGREITTHPGLLKTKSIHYQEQIPIQEREQIVEELEEECFTISMRLAQEANQYQPKVEVPKEYQIGRAHV